jgi:hypothetical protein
MIETSYLQKWRKCIGVENGAKLIKEWVTDKIPPDMEKICSGHPQSLWKQTSLVQLEVGAIFHKFCMENYYKQASYLVHITHFLHEVLQVSYIFEQ